MDGIGLDYARGGCGLYLGRQYGERELYALVRESGIVTHAFVIPDLSAPELCAYVLGSIDTQRECGASVHNGIPHPVALRHGLRALTAPLSSDEIARANHPRLRAWVPDVFDVQAVAKAKCRSRLIV